MHLQYDLAISLLGVYLREMKAYAYKSVCVQIFTTAGPVKNNTKVLKLMNE